MKWAAVAVGVVAFLGVWKMRQNDARVILAKTIWGEARGEGRAGMEAVASVIMNRTLLGGWWGDEVIEVCLKRQQFSAWNANDPNRDKMDALKPGDNAAYDMALDIADKAISGDLADTTGGATHYHTTAISPNWAAGATETARIGSHVFYTGVA